MGISEEYIQELFKKKDGAKTERLSPEERE